MAKRKYDIERSNLFDLRRQISDFLADVNNRLTSGGGGIGPKGDKGDPGTDGIDGDDGQIRFTGHGVPGTIVGSSPNDTYLDLDTGDVYKLT